MKVLLTHRYFWPDTPPYASMLKIIAASLAEQGHEVEVFASMPSYSTYEGGPVAASEKMEGFSVTRCPVFREDKKNPLTRILNVLSYCFNLYRHIRRSKPDVVTAATFPPVLAAWTASLAARHTGARFIYHMQDMHPEVSKMSGGILANALIQKLLIRLDSVSIRRSDAAVVLSDDMKQTLLSRSSARPGRIEIINNFLQGSETEEIPLRETGDRNRKFQVLFAGNIGRFQGLTKVVEAARLLKDHDAIEFVFLGDGVVLPELRELARGLSNIRFLPFMPFDQARPIIAGADLGIVSLQEGLYRIAYPSKTLTYLALGVPVLAIIEAESELARMVEAENAGVAVRERSAQAIADAVLQAYQHGKGKQDMHANARELYDQRFSTSIALSRWNSIIAATDS